jgi:hypothetical protein
MFSFGLFSTHIPYMVIAAIYLLYCGSGLLNRLGPKETDQQAPAIEIKFTELATNANLNTIQYQDIQAQEFHSGVARKQDLTFFHLLPNLLYIPDITFNDPCTGSSYFSRPPPPYC